MPQDLAAVAWPVRTARLSIRPATVEDLPGLFEIRRLPEVAEWMQRHPADRDAFVERLGDPDRLSTTLALEVEGRLIGDLYLGLADAWAQEEVAERAEKVQAEIGWVVAPDRAGRGYATEAASALLRICFEDLGLRRVKALAFADNLASRRVMEKLGMRLEEYAVAESLHRSKGWLDGVGYAILADEWRARPRDHRTGGA